MSTRCAFISSKPSSKTANRPIGPAPMMSTSVLMGSVMMRYQTRCRERRRKPAGDAAKSGLALGGFHHKAVEFVAHADLAGQTRFRTHFEGEIQHVLFHG